LDLAGSDSRVLAGSEAAAKAFDFTAPPQGSNNWALAGTLSRSGKPLMASDPHRALTLPSLRYLVHLSAPGWNVIGGGEPALPGVALGHNEHLAWGFTIAGNDQADLYVEETHPEDPTRYRVGREWQAMEIVREEVAVRGREPEAIELRFTRHGPVIYQDHELDRAYVLRWVGTLPGGEAYLGSLALIVLAMRRSFLKQSSPGRRRRKTSSTLM
jgi:penicillin amidase